MLNKRILSLLLAIVLVVGLMPTSVFATETEGTTAPTESVPETTGEAIEPQNDEEPVPCNICNVVDCGVEHKYCEKCEKYDCGKPHVICEVCKVEDCGVEHEQCDLCGEYDCDGNDVFCDTCNAWNCGKLHNITCETCGKVDCEGHDVTIPDLITTPPVDDKTEDETEEEKQCTCTPTEDGTHSAECPLYVAPTESEIEKDSAPEIEKTVIDNYNGVTVKVKAPKGAFPEGTKVSVDPVESEETLTAITDALAAKEAEYSFGPLAYDITFTYEGEEIQPAEGYNVDVSFDVGDHVSGEITDLNVYHMAEVVEEAPAVTTFSTFAMRKSASTAAVETAAEETITYEAELISSNTDSEQIEFKADSFSIYVVTGGTGENHYNYKILMSVGSTIELTSTNATNSGAWALYSGDTDKFTLSSNRGRTTNITANSEGTVRVRYGTNEYIDVTALPAVGNSYRNDIIFANIRLNIDTNNDAYTNTYGPYVMKIRFEDTEGNLLNMGEDYYTFDSDCNIDVNTFAASAPDGMTYAGAFFYWTAHNDFDGAKVYVTSVSREDSLSYGSYLWYSGTHDSSGKGSWAYQASGVLHVVYAPIDDVRTITFKDHCGYELANYALSYNDRGVYFPSGYVDNIDNMANTLIPNHHSIHDAGYEFKGTWVVTGGGNGIDGTYTTAQLKNKIVSWNIKNSNIVITAQCEEPTVITYIPVTGTTLNSTVGGTVTPGSEAVSRDASTATGSVAAPNADYEFKGWYSDATLTKQVSNNLNYVPAKPANGWVDSTYYAVFEEKSVTINYVAKTFSNGVATTAVGGSVDPTSETVAILSGTAQGSTPTANTGYEFKGWFTDENCTNPVDAAQVDDNGKFIPAKVENKNVAATYYAKFEETTATITYVALSLDGQTAGTVDLNDGNVNKVEQTSETFGIVTGNPVGATAEPISNVYKFVGWYDNENGEGEPVSTDANFDPADAPTGVPEVTTYFAKFEYNLTSMEISKSVNGEYDASDIFIFDVYCNGNLAFTVSLEGGDTVTIDGVTVGDTYKVVERTAWSSRYTASSAEISKTLSHIADDNAFSFTNTLKTTKWLSETTIKINEFNP